jgi:hypothetical protein
VKSKVAVLLLLVALTAGPAGAAAAPTPKAAVQSFFNLLKAKDYGALYQFLPNQLQQQISRDQLVKSLSRLDEFIIIDRMAIGRVQEQGDLAVVDTTIFGRLKRPMEIRGQKIDTGRVSVQQLLVKEDGTWRVATADGSTRAAFLKRHPDFSEKFQLSRPEFATKQNGKWTRLGA